MTTNEMLDVIRTHLLTFDHPTLGTVASRLGTSTAAGSDGNLFIDEVPPTLPDDAVWACMYTNDDMRGNADGGMLREQVIEVQVASHDPSNRSIINECLDIITEAWNNWIHVQSGITIIAREAHGRMTMPNEDAANPGDRDTALSRILLNFTYGAAYLSGTHKS